MISPSASFMASINKMAHFSRKPAAVIEKGEATLYVGGYHSASNINFIKHFKIMLRIIFGDQPNNIWRR